MANEGFWTSGLQGTVDRMNATLMQKGVAGDFDVTQTGLTYFDTSDSKIKRSNGATWDTLVGQNTVHDAQNHTDDTAAVGFTSTKGFTHTFNFGDSYQPEEQDLASTTITLTNQGAIEAGGCFIYLVGGAGFNPDSPTLRLYIDGVLAASVNAGMTTGSDYFFKIIGNRVCASGARIIKLAFYAVGNGNSRSTNGVSYVFAGVNKI